jgi:hypothetical protein
MSSCGGKTNEEKATEMGTALLAANPHVVKAHAFFSLNGVAYHAKAIITVQADHTEIEAEELRTYLLIMLNHVDDDDDYLEITVKTNSDTYLDLKPASAELGLHQLNIHKGATGIRLYTDGVRQHLGKSS